MDVDCCGGGICLMLPQIRGLSHFIKLQVDFLLTDYLLQFRMPKCIDFTFVSLASHLLFVKL